MSVVDDMYVAVVFQHKHERHFVAGVCCNGYMYMAFVYTAQLGDVSMCLTYNNT